MSGWSMVWLQQRGDDDAVFTPRILDPTKPLRPDIERSVTNLQRPTQAQKAKTDKNALMKRTRLPNYVHEDKYQWNKMELYADSRRCLWTTSGAVKDTKKK